MTYKMQCGHAPDKPDALYPEHDACLPENYHARIIDLTTFDLTDRKALCAYAREPKPEGQLSFVSSEKPESKAFFRARPDREYDEYYCGCRGWD